MGKGTRNNTPPTSRPEAARQLIDDEGQIFTSELHEAAWNGWVVDAPEQPEITYDGSFALGGAKYTPLLNVKVRALALLLTIARCADILFWRAGGFVPVALVMRCSSHSGLACRRQTLLTPEKKLARVRGSGVRKIVSFGALLVLCMFLMRLNVCRQSIDSTFNSADTACTRALPALLCTG